MRNGFAAAAALGILLADCGGTVETIGQGPGDDTGDSGPAQDSGGQDTGTLDAQPGRDGSPVDGGRLDSPLSPLCPPTGPAPGSACTDETLQCEYGGAWWSVACDDVLQCQSGLWTVFHPSYDPCSPAPGPNPSSCADYTTLSQGGSCDVQGTSCYFSQGVCSCQAPLGGPVQIDAGNDAYWGCLPGSGCPWPRPMLGSACATEGTSCTYEECSYGQSCQNGIWQGDLEGCAGAQGGP